MPLFTRTITIGALNDFEVEALFDADDDGNVEFISCQLGDFKADRYFMLAMSKAALLAAEASASDYWAEEGAEAHDDYLRADAMWEYDV